MTVTANGVIALDADIHVLAPADVIVTGADAVVGAFCRAFDADQPANYRREALHAADGNRLGGIAVIVHPGIRTGIVAFIYLLGGAYVLAKDPGLCAGHRLVKGGSTEGSGAGCAVVAGLIEALLRGGGFIEVVVSECHDSFPPFYLQ